MTLLEHLTRLAQPCRGLTLPTHPSEGYLPPRQLEVIAALQIGDRRVLNLDDIAPIVAPMTLERLRATLCTALGSARLALGPH